MNKVVIVLLLMVCIYHQTYAQAKIGNGGENVVCRAADGKINSIELLDLYEARVLRGVSINLGPKSLSVDQKVELAISRIEARDKTRAHLYRKWLKNFMKGITWVKIPLPATPDIDPSIFPEGCKIEQVAVQKDNRRQYVIQSYDEGAEIEIYRPFWDFMDNDQKAALVLHEIIYHEVLDKKSISAEPIRYFNTLILGDDLKGMDLFEYIEVLDNMGAQIVEIFGLGVFLPTLLGDSFGKIVGKEKYKDVFFYPSGLPKALVLAEKSQDFVFKNMIFKLSAREEVKFYDQHGGIKSASFKNSVEVKTSLGKPFICESYILFSETGELQKCYLRQGLHLLGDKYQVETSEANLAIFINGELDFFSLKNYEGTIVVSGTSFPVTSKNGYIHINGGPIPIQVKGVNINIERYIHVNQNWQLDTFSPVDILEMDVQGTRVRMKNKTQCSIYRNNPHLYYPGVGLHPNGEISFFVLDQPATLGRTRFKGDEIVRINTNGKITSGGMICDFYRQ